MNRIGQAVLIAVLSIVGLSGAHAAGKRVGVPKFSGAQEALVRKKVMQVLKAHGYELVRSRDMQSAADIAGVSLNSEDGLRAVAKELALVAIVTGSVSGKHAKLAVHDGSDGSTLGEANFAGASPRKLGGEVGAAFWRKLGGEITRGKLPSGAKKDQKASAPEADEDKEDTGEAAGGAAEESESGKSKPAAEAEGGAAAEETGASKKKSKHEGAAAEEESAPSAPTGLPWLDLSIGFAGLNRNLSYHEVAYPPANQPSPYSLPFWPVGVANAVFYLEPLVGGLLGNLGVEAHGMLGLGVSSKLSSNTTSFSSTVHDFAGGARYRFPFGAANDLFLSATYGEDAFTFNGPSRSTLLTPDTIYHYFRGGFGVQLALTNEFKVDVGGGYRAVLNKGGSQITNAFFPHLTVAGADAEAALTWSFSDYYALRLGVAWKRYWYDMHSRQGDLFLVGGAVDQSFLFSLSLVVQVSSGAHGEAEAAPTDKDKGKAKPAKGGDDASGGGSEGGGGEGEKTSGGVDE
ncbi:MAG TPA: hypothetical protein VHO67_18005 [Polyangia bacterium]|nr:hypothetical protein [Polyangia bacterium]